jgi:hypothetical protein
MTILFSQSPHGRPMPTMVSRNNFSIIHRLFYSGKPLPWRKKFLLLFVASFILLMIGTKQSSIIRGIFIWEKYLPFFVDRLMVSPWREKRECSPTSPPLFEKNLHIYLKMLNYS